MSVRAPRMGIVRCSPYKFDPWVRRQAEALVAHRYAVDVICQRQPGEPAVEQIGGMTVWRVGTAKYRGHSLARYALASGSFFLHALAVVTRLHRRYGYAAV